MAASAAKSGFGTTVAYESAPSVFTTIGELVSVKPPSRTREAISVTHMASPDAHEEVIGGLFKGGDSVMNFNHTDTGAVLLHTLLDAGLETFKITAPNGATWLFSALPVAVETEDLVINDKMAMSMTVTPSGKPVFAAGT